MSRAKSYALATAKVVFVAGLVVALFGGAGFDGKPLSERLVGGTFIAALQAALLAALAAAWGFLKDRRARRD